MVMAADLANILLHVLLQAREILLRPLQVPGLKILSQLGEDLRDRVGIGARSWRP